MDKEEILSKSRQEKKDEGEEYIESKGRRTGEIGMFCAYLIIIFYNLFKGLENNVAFSLFWTYIGLSGLGKYRLSRTRAHLVVGGCGITAAVCYFAAYVIETW